MVCEQVQEQIPWTWVPAPATTSKENPFVTLHLPSDGAAAPGLGDKIFVDVSKSPATGLGFKQTK